jgi:diguanylate cyclase (GGDEF)-like protein
MSNFNVGAILPSSHRRLSYHKAMSWLLIILAGLYLGTITVRLYRHKRLLEDQTAQQVTNVSLSMRRALSLQKAQVQAVEARVADLLTAHFPSDLRHADRQQINRLQRMMTQETFDNDDLALLGVADVDGHVLYMSTDVTPVHQADRIDVSAWHAQPALAMKVSIRAAEADSAWPGGLVIVRPVRQAGGAPRAFVFAALSYQSFLYHIAQQHEAGFTLGAHSTIFLIEKDSDRLVFRYPMIRAVVGQPMRPVQATSFRQQPYLYFWRSPYDHVERLHHIQLLGGGGFNLGVGAATADYLSPWYAELRFSAISGALLLAAVALSLVLIRRVARQAAQLQHDKEQLNIGARATADLIAAAPVALAEVRVPDGKLLRTNPAFVELFGLLPGQPRGMAEALFAEPDRWAALCAGAALAAPGADNCMELDLRIGDTTRRALVATAPLPRGHGQQQELLLTFIDTEAQHAQEMTLAEIAYTDALTGLANRRAFFLQADAAFAIARRYQRPLALLMVDLDHFKQINDRYGHAAGDVVLARTAACLRQSLRDADLPARLGGEEFVVMLPETSLASAMAAAERIRETLAQASIEHDGQGIAVTASIGVATLQSDSADIASILSAADQALYEAKARGRNRVVAARHAADAALA